MAYQNFIPTVWNASINRELERALVFAEDCNREYEGDVKKMGDTVRILGVGKPTITTTSNKEITLASPENVEDTSVTMPIKQVSYFNFKVDDIDKRQAAGNVMEALRGEATHGLANEMDKHIASVAAAKEAFKMDATISAASVLAEIDKGIQKLYENDVAANTELVITVSPRFYFLLKQAYTNLDTDNSKILENGRVGRYGNVVVKMSNNVAVDGAADLIMLRTKKAVAFVNPMTHTEAYRPESGFSDALKGFVLYQAKIVRPKELVVIRANY